MEYIVDIVLIALFLFVTLRGWKRGFVASLLSYGRVILAAVVARIFSPLLAPWLQEAFIGGLFDDADPELAAQLAASLSSLVALVITFLVASVLFTFIIKLISNLISHSPLAAFDKILGLALGAVTGVFTVMIVAGLGSIILTIIGKGELVENSKLIALFGDFLMSMLEDVL